MEDQTLAQLADYQPSAETIRLVQDTPLLFLVGISGAGKGTILRELFAKGGYHPIISHTTRQPRENQGKLERDGVEYHFVSTDEALKMAAAQAFVELKVVHGTIYGTSAAEIASAKAEGRIAMTDIDVQGVAEYKQLSPQGTIAVFVVPPSFDVWQQRLLSRYGAEGPSVADLVKRTNTAIGELEHALETDYYHFVINDDLERVVVAVDKIAHGDDSFNDKDQAARAQAQVLLADIKEHLAL